jgi:hypothetical protein
MKRTIDIDILIASKKLISNYFIMLEFQGTKISSYDKAIYNALKLAINGKKKDELFKKR